MNCSINVHPRLLSTGSFTSTFPTDDLAQCLCCVLRTIWRTFGAHLADCASHSDQPTTYRFTAASARFLSRHGQTDLFGTYAIAGYESYSHFLTAFLRNCSTMAVASDGVCRFCDNTVAQQRKQNHLVLRSELTVQKGSMTWSYRCVPFFFSSILAMADSVSEL